MFIIELKLIYFKLNFEKINFWNSENPERYWVKEINIHPMLIFFLYFSEKNRLCETVASACDKFGTETEQQPC